MSINIEVEAGKSKRLLTAGKFCDRDILVTAKGITEEELQAAYQRGWIEAKDKYSVFINDTIQTVPPFMFSNNNLTTISLSNLRDTTGGSVFSYCPELEYVYLPNYAGRKTGYFFNTCYKLKTVDFGSALEIGINAFIGCTSLEVVVLRKADTITAILSPNAFTQTPDHIKVYVPSALIDTYKAATNWSFLYTYEYVDFVALEGSEYE